MRESKPPRTTSLILAASPVLALGFAASLAAQPAESSRSHVPGARVDVLIENPMTLSVDEDRRAMERLIAGCRERLSVSPEDSASAVEHDAWSALRRIPLGPAVVALVIVPRDDLLIDCGGGASQVWLSAARGLRITYDTTYNPRRDIQGVRVLRGTRAITPISTDRQAVTRLGAGGLRGSGFSHLRVTVLLDDLAPDSTGRVSDLVIAVFNPEGEVPDQVHIPEAIVTRIWIEALAGRAAAAARGPLPAGERVALPTPRDPALGSAVTAYLSGEIAEAQPAALARLQSGALDAGDRRIALVQLAATFAAVGDIQVARLLFADLVQDDPCFTFASDAPASAREVLAPVARPPARCEARTPRQAAIRAALMPGFGGPPGSLPRATRIFVAGGIAAGVVTGALKTLEANREYETYLAIVPGHPSAGRIGVRFEAAERARRLSIVGYSAGLAIWGASVLHAVLSERAYSRELDVVRDFGAPRGARVGLSPMVSASRIGFSLSFQ